MTRTTVGIKKAVPETALLSNVTFDELTVCKLPAAQAIANREKLACAEPNRTTIPTAIKVLGLNHFNITASRLLIEEVKRFYTDVIGLTVGPRALLNHEGYWLYAGSVAIVHLSVHYAIEAAIPAQKSHFNHISLSCVGLSLAIAKLNATRTPYRIIELSSRGQTQLFVTDPAGIGVELTFDERL